MSQYITLGFGSGSQFLPLSGPYSIPATNQKHVEKWGSDITGNGSFLTPYLTIGKAYSVITDASISNLYRVSIGPGTYIELSSFEILPNIWLNGSGTQFTRIKRSDDSDITSSPPVIGDISDTRISNLTFIDGINITRPSIPATPSTQTWNEECDFIFDGVTIQGDFTYNGAGFFNDDTVVGNIDGVTFYQGDIFGSVSVNGAGFGAYQTVIEGSVACRDSPTTFPTGTAAVIASDDTLHTVTVAPGSNFSPYPALIWAYTGDFTAFTYDSYNSGTGIFTNAQPFYNFGSTNLPIAGQNLTNFWGSAGILVGTRHGNITIKSAAPAGASSAILRVLGGWSGGRINIDGVNAKNWSSIDGLTRVGPNANSNSGLLFFNGAVDIVNNTYGSRAFQLGYTPTTPANWISVPTTAQTGFDNLATNKIDTLAAVGSAPSANGASISGKTLTLQPADATHPGVVTTGTQTLAGAKTFPGVLILTRGSIADATSLQVNIDSSISQYASPIVVNDSNGGSTDIFTVANDGSVSCADITSSGLGGINSVTTVTAQGLVSGSNITPHILPFVNFPTGGNILTSDVDANQCFNVNQTTAAQTITIQNPTVTTIPRMVYVVNTGSTSFTLISAGAFNNTVNAGSAILLLWNGSDYFTAV